MDGNQRSQPGGTPALRASSSMSAICFLLFSISPFTRSSSASAFWRSSAICARCDGIVARGEVGRQRVDAALQRLGEHLVAPQLVARLSNPATPRFFVLRVGRTRLPLLAAGSAFRPSARQPPPAPMARQPDPLGQPPPSRDASVAGGALAGPHPSGRRWCRPWRVAWHPLRRSCSFLRNVAEARRLRDDGNGKGREAECRDSDPNVLAKEPHRFDPFRV